MSAGHARQGSARTRPLGRGPFRETLVVDDKEELRRVIEGIRADTVRRSTKRRKRARGSAAGTGRGRPVEPESFRSFAKRSKISQSTLSHLLAGERRWIQRRTYERLRRCAGPWGLRLERCFGGDAAAVIRDEAADWFVRELDRPEAKRGLSAVERKRLRSLYEESPRLRRAVERLNRALSATDSQVGRRLAAYCSAVAPLNRFFETGGLERGFNELSDTELANFVAWGLDRERVLLHRPRDVIRRQWMSANFENFNEQKARRSSELGKADATCSWDFMNAERLYANKPLANDWAE